jgi:RNA polymerase sigma factor (sigma-70 family)
VALFRGGNEEAFRVIHDRYRQRLFAYTRQMLPGSRQDAEDALQDVFVRAYSGLRANEKQLALRPWLYRIAHNRCVDELRRPVCAPAEMMELLSAPVGDPIVEAERRESLRRLITDLRRLPDQQRSALLMRELGGMSYGELAAVLGLSLPALKSLLVRARLGLVQAHQARETACSTIQEDLILAHDRGVRPSGNARRHMRDCSACRSFRHSIRGTSRQLAAFAPTLGPAGMIAKLLGLGSGAAAGGSSCAAAGGGGGALAASGAVTASTGHIATLLAAMVLTAGGALEMQNSLSASGDHRAPARHHVTVTSVAAVTGQSAAANPPRTPMGIAPPQTVGAGATTPAPGSAAGSASGATGPGQASAGSSRASTDATHQSPTVGLDGGGLDPGGGSMTRAATSFGGSGGPQGADPSTTGSGAAGGPSGQGGGQSGGGSGTPAVGGSGATSGSPSGGLAQPPAGGLPAQGH